MVKRPTWRDVVVPIAIGAFALWTVMHRPQWANIRSIDALELVAAGIMFGFAIRAAAMILHDHRER